MIKSLHGRGYYFEVGSYKEADKVIEIFQSIPAFARNSIGLTTGYDTDDNKLYVYCYILKERPIAGFSFFCSRHNGLL